MVLCDIMHYYCSAAAVTTSVLVRIRRVRERIIFASVVWMTCVLIVAIGWVKTAIIKSAQFLLDASRKAGVEGHII